MDNLTILYYTANRISDRFAENVRAHLLASSGGDIPIVSISQRTIDFGHNICVDDIGASAYNVYKQILIGAREARTAYVACCEDDTLYSAEHFDYRPPLSMDTFAYNLSRWWIEPEGVFRYRDRTSMCACIAPTALMVETLEERFARFPEPITDRIKLQGWGESGRYEYYLGLAQRKMLHFQTHEPVITFNHRPSLGGKRRTNPTDILRDDLPGWGSAKELWETVYVS